MLISLSTFLLAFASFSWWIIERHQKDQEMAPEFIPDSTEKIQTLPQENLSPAAVETGISIHSQDSLAITRQVRNRIEALGSLNLPLFLSVYNQSRFQYSGGHFASWKLKHQELFNRVQAIEVYMEKLSLYEKNGEIKSSMLETRIVARDTLQKQIEHKWCKEDGVWLICGEMESNPARRSIDVGQN